MTGRCNLCGRGSVTIDPNSRICAKCWTNNMRPPTPPPFSFDVDDLFGTAPPPPPPPPPPKPVAKQLTEDEKKLERLKKYMAHAARREGNENEAKAFASRIFKMLEADLLPLRYLVSKGSEVRVIPTHLIKNPHNTSVLRTVRSHQRHMFSEMHRLKNDDGRKAIDKGWLAFDRHGYTVFVRLADVQVFF